MADSLNQYILYDFNVYTGASGGERDRTGRKVMLQLAKSIEGNHHHLHFDNYFSSITLLSKLEDGTYACGTIGTNRKQYPTEISEEAKWFGCGQSTFHQCGNLVATVWKVVGKCINYL